MLTNLRNLFKAAGDVAGAADAKRKRLALQRDLHQARQV